MKIFFEFICRRGRGRERERGREGERERGREGKREGERERKRGIYSLPGSGLVTQIRRLCLQFV
jgi:hypothetical protein